MNWIDGAILLWLGWGAMNGFRRGLFRTGARVAGLFLGFWAAAAFASPVAAFLERLGVARLITQWITQGHLLSAQVAEAPLDRLSLEQLPVLLAQSGMPLRDQSLFLDNFSEQYNLAVAAGLTTVGQMLSGFIGTMVLKAVAFLLVLSLVQGAAALAGGVLQQTVGRLPLLGGLNRFGGLGCGLLQGLIGVTVLVGVVTPLVGLLRTPVTDTLAGARFVPPLLSLFNGGVGLWK